MHATNGHGRKHERLSLCALTSLQFALDDTLMKWKSQGKVVANGQVLFDTWHMLLLLTLREALLVEYTLYTFGILNLRVKAGCWFGGLIHNCRRAVRTSAKVRHVELLNHAVFPPIRAKTVHDIAWISKVQDSHISSLDKTPILKYTTRGSTYLRCTPLFLCCNQFRPLNAQLVQSTS